ncbi:2,4-dienoyl-CoA reductase [Shigella flexneri]
MGSIRTGLSHTQDGAERLAAFYAERARHGVALIVSGGIAPDLTGVAHGRSRDAQRRQPNPHHRTAVAEAVHQEGSRRSPCKFCIPGATATNRIWSLPPHCRPPSTVFIPRELTPWRSCN